MVHILSYVLCSLWAMCNFLFHLRYWLSFWQEEGTTNTDQKMSLELCLKRKSAITPCLKYIRREWSFANRTILQWVHCKIMQCYLLNWISKFQLFALVFTLCIGLILVLISLPRNEFSFGQKPAEAILIYSSCLQRLWVLAKDFPFQAKSWKQSLNLILVQLDIRLCTTGPLILKFEGFFLSCSGVRILFTLYQWQLIWVESIHPQTVYKIQEGILQGRRMLVKKVGK